MDRKGRRNVQGGGERQRRQRSDTTVSTARLQEAGEGGAKWVLPAPAAAEPLCLRWEHARKEDTGGGTGGAAPLSCAPAKPLVASSAVGALPPAQAPRRPATPAIGSLKMPL